jgi:hypothetical protein
MSLEIETPGQEGKRPLVLVALDFHEARKTEARTWWTLLNNSPDLDNPIFVEGRDTHMTRYFILDPEQKLIRHRISNSGKYSYQIFKATELEVPFERIPPEKRPKWA